MEVVAQVGADWGLNNVHAWKGTSSMQSLNQTWWWRLVVEPHVSSFASYTVRTKECCFFCQVTYLVNLFFIKTQIRGHNLFSSDCEQCLEQKWRLLAVDCMPTWHREEVPQWAQWAPLCSYLRPQPKLKGPETFPQKPEIFTKGLF